MATKCDTNLAIDDNNLATFKDSLPLKARKIYDKKVSRIGPDPFKLEEDVFELNGFKWPDIVYVDIAEFLCFKQRFYTKAEMKDHKSTEAYRVYLEDRILEVLHKDVNGKHLLRSKVTRDVRCYDNPFVLWILATDDGTIETAHCSCMLNHSNCCIHIGAVLFAIEVATQCKNDPTDKDDPALWMFPNKRDPESLYKPLSEIDFGLPEGGTDDEYDDEASDSDDI